jgi:hypothetical protein
MSVPALRIAPGLPPGPPPGPNEHPEAGIIKTINSPEYKLVRRVKEVQKPTETTSFQTTIGEQGLLVWIPNSKFPKDSSIRAKIGLEPPSATETEGAWYHTLDLHYPVWRSILDEQQEEKGISLADGKFYTELLSAIWNSVQQALDAGDTVYSDTSKAGRLDSRNVNNLEMLVWVAESIRSSGKMMNLTGKGTFKPGIYVWQDWENSWMWRQETVLKVGSVGSVGGIEKKGNWTLDDLESCTIRGKLFCWERVKYSFGSCKTGVRLEPV